MSRPSSVDRSLLPNGDPDAFAKRYELHELLGEGGMARVHRAIDTVLGRQVALKQLFFDHLAAERAPLITALFEREFHTLAQLKHPHVIEVFDYGISPGGTPFYTMELLDGGDLRELAPLPWRDACQHVFDVCSALALLHSRRLLHRDVTPRNIRCTSARAAKLIDFGAMSPMTAGGAELVGTPAFTAPEALQRLALDARTDLYALGVTLYYALTGQVPYPTRTFADLMVLWAEKPTPPSAFAPEIPVALDDLVLALINVQPALRPSSAFEVMQRLAACAGLRAEESEAVSRSYLSTPTLVGRDDVLEQLRAQLAHSRLRRTAGVLIEAAPGVGRSRVLDACALHAVTHGFTVSRATATGAREPFAVAQRLTAHVLDTLPRVAQLSSLPELFTNLPAANDEHARPKLVALAQLEPSHAQALLRRFFQSVSSSHPLLIAVDDVHKIDEPSAALLAELIDRTPRGGILVALSADSEAPPNAALKALARRCSSLALAPLSREQTRQLLASVFGEVANLQMLNEELHHVALGNAAQTLELAQHLVDHGVIRYAAGSWTIPSRLSADDLPQSSSATLQRRIARFSEHARFLAQAQALAFYEAFTDADYRGLLPEASSRDVDMALSELLESGAVLRDGAVYRLANRVWSAAFLASLDAEQTQLRHRALANMYLVSVNMGFVHHAFAGGLDELGLSGLEMRRGPAPSTEADLLELVEQGAGKLMWCYPLAIAAAQRLGRTPRQVNDLRRWQYLGSVVSNHPLDRESAKLWLAQLSHDAGLDLYRSDTTSATQQERLTNALTRAHERYLATPEGERVYPVEEAIRLLGEYVVVGVVEGARALDVELLHSLPDLVEPYVPLSPLLEAIWLNMLGARHSHCYCDYESARALWQQMLDKLDAVGESGELFVASMRNAVIFAIGSAEAQLGLASAASWASRLDSDPFQRISALNLRKMVRLEQGDAEGAERYRRQAEVLALQQRYPSMFHISGTFDIFAYSQCNDLAGLTQVIEHIRPLAARYPRWVPVLLSAEGSFQQLRGDYEAACVKYQACLEFDRQGPDGAMIYPWTRLSSQVGLAECWLNLGRVEEARAFASAALTAFEARCNSGIGPASLVRVLALAQAKLGDPRGVEQLDALIAKQAAIGATGLRIALSYEARARTAIWSGDAAAFETFSQLTAREYRHGARTTLGARYERLMNEAARHGMQAQLTLADFQAIESPTSVTSSDERITMLTRSITGQRSARERTKTALQAICTAQAASEGHLYLITPAGPLLSASHGHSTPSQAIAERVAAYVTEYQSRADDLDDMATGMLEDAFMHDAILDAGARRYELLPLHCVVDAASVLVGVAVVEMAGDRRQELKRGQLLHAVAQTLLAAGDTPGLALHTHHE
jgi:hypothetical protein